MVQLIGENNGSPKSVDQIRVKCSACLLMEKIMEKSHLENCIRDKLNRIIKKNISYFDKISMCVINENPML